MTDERRAAVVLLCVRRRHCYWRPPTRPSWAGSRPAAPAAASRTGWERAAGSCPPRWKTTVTTQPGWRWELGCCRCCCRRAAAKKGRQPLDASAASSWERIPVVVHRSLRIRHCCRACAAAGSSSQTLCTAQARAAYEAQDLKRQVARQVRCVAHTVQGYGWKGQQRTQSTHTMLTSLVTSLPPACEIREKPAAKKSAAKKSTSERRAAAT